MGLLPAEAGQLAGAIAQGDITETIKLNLIRLWIGLDKRCKWGHYSYFNLPKRHKPSPLNFIVKSSTNKKKMIAP